MFSESKYITGPLVVSTNDSTKKNRIYSLITGPELRDGKLKKFTSRELLTADEK